MTLEENESKQKYSLSADDEFTFQTQVFFRVTQSLRSSALTAVNIHHLFIRIRPYGGNKYINTDIDNAVIRWLFLQLLIIPLLHFL